MQVIKTIIVDDHPIYREGLKKILQKHPYYSIEIIGEAKNGLEVLRLLRKMTPHLLILDLNMPVKDGLDVLREMPRKRMDVKVVALTMYEDTKVVKAALKAGANAYVLKTNATEELYAAISTVLEGSLYMGINVSLSNSEISENIKQVEKKAVFEEKFAKKHHLTKRELEVLKLISEALSNKEIGKRLYISDQTVKVHRKNIMRKLNVNTATGLVKMAYDNSLV